MKGTTVVFFEERTGTQLSFDCSTFPVAVPMQQWLACRLSEQFSARSGTKGAVMAKNYFYTARFFARALAACDPAPQTPAHLTPEHIQAFRARHSDSPAVLRSHLKLLRVLLRDCDELAPSALDDLMRTRLPEVPPVDPVLAYTEHEWQDMMTALRRTIRLARDRIRAGTLLLARYRSGDEGLNDREVLQGRLLEQFCVTGDLPRTASGGYRKEVLRAGGASTLHAMLCLSQSEAAAFALLLSALTAENFGTVAQWPAAHTRPDGAAGTHGVALVEESKPRRGPEREHMIVALEDLPASLGEVIESGQRDAPLFRSPLRIYELLLELTAVARHLTGSPSAFICRAPKAQRRTGQPWSTVALPRQWALANGFPDGSHAEPGGKPAIHSGRIRQTALELLRRPVAHSRHTLRDHYLRRSATVRAESRIVVADALRSQVEQARTIERVPVVTQEVVVRAEADLDAAAAEAGLAPEVLRRMLSGAQDTAISACTDHLAGPRTPPGTPCLESFFVCLTCQNARALPHQLPVQLAVHDRILALRPNLDPATWRVRYQDTAARLKDILDHYGPTEHAHARTALTDAQRQLVEDLLEGRMDLR
jgi:hypothetical protein